MSNKQISARICVKLQWLCIVGLNDSLLSPYDCIQCSPCLSEKGTQVLVLNYTDQILIFTFSEEEAATREADEPAGGKRKRTSDEGENTAKVAKKRRSKHSEKSVSTAEPAKRGGRTRRSQRSRRGEEEEATEKTKPLLHPAPIPPEEDSVCIVEDLLSGEDTGKKGVVAFLCVF